VQSQPHIVEVPSRLVERARQFLRRHGKKLWWLHSAYALGLGTLVVVFAQKGFEHARWLAVTLGLAWLVLCLFFRLFGEDSRAIEQASPKVRVRFYVMTYVLKNLYQGMLFFLVPFYWKSTTFDAPNAWFVLVLCTCAIVSTLDLVFDRILMRWRFLASAFHGITLFGCINLVIPALFPNTRTLYSLVCAGAITVMGFFTLHVPASALRSKWSVALLTLGVVAGGGLVYLVRMGIPPVPMYVSQAAVGPLTLPDGRLAMEVKTLHASVIEQLLAVTDVVVPGGKGDALHHVWRRDGAEVQRFGEGTSRVDGPFGTVRLRSTLSGKNLPAQLAGRWSVDVETKDGQLVGRTHFTVTD
jgi:hypothetical protein